MFETAYRKSLCDWTWLVHLDFLNKVVTKFAEEFNMPEGLRRLVQGFWLLDHQYFEVPLLSHFIKWSSFALKADNLLFYLFASGTF